MIARRLVEQEDDLPLPLIMEATVPAGRRTTCDGAAEDEFVIQLQEPGLA